MLAHVHNVSASLNVLCVHLSVCVLGHTVVSVHVWEGMRERLSVRAQTVLLFLAVNREL